MTTAHPSNARTIAFIGGGNMAASLIGGILGSGFQREDLWVSEPDPGKQEALAKKFGVHVTGDNIRAAEKADTLVFAVKPQFIRQIARELAGTLASRRPLIVSVAAGVREPDIRRWAGGEAAIVRVMPNTPALVGSGAAALFANDRVTAIQRDRAESLLRSVGSALWVGEESELDAVTALSGSGPAYFFRVMEVMESAGRALGLSPEASRLLTLETAFGAAKMALESPEDPGVLRERVTSPGGTTERALTVLDEGDIRGLFENALRAARDRAVEIGIQLGEN